MPHERPRRWLAAPGCVAAVLVALALSPLLIGIEPMGGDPERLYRPIKAELARALREGRLPWWSERFGMGLPLIAESHVAAFYPPNWLLYGTLDVNLAYRLAMWSHHVLMAVGTCVYARRLGIGRAGSVLAGVSFALCGFNAIHASHEVFYHALAYLPWALVLADAFATTGRAAALAGLALVLGAQWTLGHFQIQTWTAGLVLITGWARAWGTGRLGRRGVGLVLGVAWGAVIAAVQLGPSWELARFVGQSHRAINELMYYSFPPSHWVELAIPTLFRRIPPMDNYWHGQFTSGYESCFHVGTVPLVLACLGLFGRERPLHVWRALVPLAFAVATMPRWWPEGYRALLMVPGLGWFRAPARYLVIASLGLALLAGAGLDRLLLRRTIGGGALLAMVLGLIAFASAGALWRNDPTGAWHAAYRTGPQFVRLALALPVMLWVGTLGLLAALRVSSRRGARPFPLHSELASLFALLMFDLCCHYYFRPIEWGRQVRIPEASRVLMMLRNEPNVGRIAGVLENQPVRAGLATAVPYTGFDLAEPNRALKRIAGARDAWSDAVASEWLARLGVTHAVDAQDDAAQTLPPAGLLTLVFRGEDASLSRATNRPESSSWQVTRLGAPPGPAAWIATRWRIAPDQRTILQHAILSAGEANLVWFLPEHVPRDQAAPAHSARVVEWEGASGVVEHDGAAVLVWNQSFFPGWHASVDGHPTPIVPANGGLQSVRLLGAGRRRVEFTYQPTGRAALACVSLGTLMLAAVVVGFTLRRWGA